MGKDCCIRKLGQAAPRPAPPRPPVRPVRYVASPGVR
jgi:hypothetical protein